MRKIVIDYIKIWANFKFSWLFCSSEVRQTIFPPKLWRMQDRCCFLTVPDPEFYRIRHRLEHLLHKVGHITVSFNISPVFCSRKQATHDPNFGSPASQTYLLSTNKNKPIQYTLTARITPAKLRSLHMPAIWSQKTEFHFHNFFDTSISHSEPILTYQ